MEFEEWMVAEGLSPSTIKKYAGAIDGSLSKWSANQGAAQTPLRTIHDAQEFAALSEFIEKTDIFAERNARGNHMYGAALKSYARYLAALPLHLASPPTTPFSQALAAAEDDEELYPVFEPNDQEDARARVLRAVVRRQGQPLFRAGLIAAYDSRCAISGCKILQVLEAAHITPYLGPASNLISNGILLRADIHTLWDLSLIAIDPETLQVVVSQIVNDATYQALTGTVVHRPTTKSDRPSISALRQQWESFQTSVIG